MPIACKEHLQIFQTFRLYLYCKIYVIDEVSNLSLRNREPLYVVWVARLVSTVYKSHSYAKTSLYCSLPY